MPDDSWTLEFAESLDDIRLQRPSSPGIRDAQEGFLASSKSFTERLNDQSPVVHAAYHSEAEAPIFRLITEITQRFRDGCRHR